MLLFLFSYEVSALFAVIHLHCSFLLATAAAAAAADVAADCCCCWLYNFTLLRTGITCTRIHTHMYFNCTVSNLFFSATYSSHELWNFDTRREIIANNINTASIMYYTSSFVTSISSLFIVQLFLFRLKSASKTPEPSDMDCKLYGQRSFEDHLFWVSFALIEKPCNRKWKNEIIFKNNFHFLLFIDVFIDEINMEKVVVYRLPAGETTNVNRKSDMNV